MFDHPDYSYKEQVMFHQLGFGHLIGKVDIWGLYRIAMEDCFINDNRSPAAESLRKCIGAMSYCNPYRMTPEFDDLIQL